ncbi:tRNA pseudouridine(55) synthase TruB [archaeon]|nr:MAG: tRNA pseudouridine(55) synthase TruB [archaeon]
MIVRKSTLIHIFVVMLSYFASAFAIPGGNGRVIGRALANNGRSAPVLVYPPDGLLAVYKPKGWSSADAVNKVKRAISFGLSSEAKAKSITTSTAVKAGKFKIGHGGTLDPLAEGVLVMGVGRATKAMGEYLAGRKEYVAVAKTGTGTDTLDSTGMETESKEFRHVNRDLILSKLPMFTGDILQIPPMYSALYKDGKRLYEYARAGIEVERTARSVTAYHIELLEDARLQFPEYFSLRIQSSGGFYVRSLLVDLAHAMDTTAHMIALTRTQQGAFRVEDCLHIGEKIPYESICENIAHSSAKVNMQLL